jgi:mannose-1-phosphate guanylyltransferase/phosphomannomutase
MIPVANRPLMEHVVDLLRGHGFCDIVVTVAFQANAIQNYFGNGAEFGVRMVYASEEPPRGTAGSVRNAMAELHEPFLVISGDVLTDIDLGAVVDYHRRKQALATIALRSMPNPLEFGIVMTNPDGSVERFLEKPSWGEVFSDTINTGIYVFEPGIFDFIAEGVSDFSADVFPLLLGGPPLVYGFISDGYWEDIGTLQAYARAHQDILDGRVHVDLPGFSLRNGIWLGEGAEVDPAAHVQGPAIIGDYCRVDAGATLGEYTVLGRNVRVGVDAFIERAVAHDNAYLGPGVRLRGCTVGRGSDLRRGARIEEGVVLGDECFIGEHAVVHAGVKIFPFKTVEHGAIVNSSIVWESRGARHLFGRLGVSGLANVDISPELAVRLAMAFATTMPRGATVTVSRDTGRVARMLKQAVTVGLNAAGADVADLEVATVPVSRFGVRHEHSAGGVSVRSSSEDPQSVVLRFFDGNGIDLPEAAQRKVERIFYREDFRRCLAEATGDIGYPVRVPDLYARVLLGQVDNAAIRAAHFKVVLDYALGTASSIMPYVLGKLGAEVLSVNPYPTSEAAASFDRWEHAQGVSSLVRAAGAHFGAVIGPEGERITLVDDNGRTLSDREGLLALLSLVFGQGLVPGQERSLGPAGQGAARSPAGPPASPASSAPVGRPEPSAAMGTEPHGSSRQDNHGHNGLSPGDRTRRAALPVSAPSTAGKICEEAGATLVWTKLSAAHLMEVASQPGVEFAGSLDGGYIFPRFLPAYDAVATLVHTFALLAVSGAKLSDVVAGLPPVFTVHEAVVTPWEKKGLVMRSVMELSAGKPVTLVDGVKVAFPDGWSLVVPDPEEALTNVWAEGPTEAAANARAHEYARLVRGVLRV